ncbi:uncharacterized protein LOC123366659 [Mauremys mutica]|uniref:uncharacterized protein LOC123366659 n=1 Tax=Mauremys mutica TaxID=74926 RepID=UPI001D16B4C8|nr:uncharacterized protein LOC123366659 [Mauremys mutica]
MLDAILGGDPTSITKSPMDTWAGLDVAKRGPNPEDTVIDEKVELDDNVELLSGSPCGAGSQERFTTPEVSSQSQQLLSGEQEAGKEMPADVAFRNTLHTLAKRLCQIRKCPRRSKDDMFWEVLHFSDAEKRERKDWWKAERQDRKENHEFVKDASEWMIKVMEEQMQLLESLIMLQPEQMHACPPLQHIQNFFPCPAPNFTRTVLSAFRDFLVSPSLHPLRQLS